MVLSKADAEHFCRRVGFSGTEAEVDHFTGREIADVVSEVLDISPVLPARPSWAELHAWWEGIERGHVWWFDRMARASWVNRTGALPSPLVEKLVLLWHGHFACGIQKVESITAMFDQQQLFREHALGDFETMVQTVSVSGAMLRYIDNETNVKGAEQENFARELMELHTIGVGNFTEQDVIAMARAWTGHNIVGWVDSPDGGYMDATYRYYPEYHDEGNKTLFGITRNWDAPETITELVRGSKQAACARFVATKVWKFFVNGTPTDDQITTLADAFVASDMQLRELVRAALEHPEFWAPSSRWAQVRSPIEFVVEVLRRTEVPLTTDLGLTWLLPSMGQEPWEPPNVAGWGTHGYWVSTAGAWGKGRFLEQLRWHDHFGSYFADLEAMERTEAVNRILTTFGITDPTTATRSRLGNWFDTTKRDHSWALKHNALVVGGMLPEFQVA